MLERGHGLRRGIAGDPCDTNDHCSEELVCGPDSHCQFGRGDPCEDDSHCAPDDSTWSVPWHCAPDDVCRIGYPGDTCSSDSHCIGGGLCGPTSLCGGDEGDPCTGHEHCRYTEESFCMGGFCDSPWD